MAECPECGNTDAKLMEDNGLEKTSYDYTLLCIAPNPDNDDGLCGCQWEPNNDWEWA